MVRRTLSAYFLGIPPIFDHAAFTSAQNALAQATPRSGPRAKRLTRRGAGARPAVEDWG
jgi:hypothetical protein